MLNSMQILWLLVVCPYLLVAWGLFIAVLSLSSIVYAACGFLVLRSSCPLFMLGFGEIQKLCCHRHHLPRIFKFTKFQHFGITGVLTLQRSNHLVTGFGSRVMRTQVSWCADKCGPPTSWPLSVPFGRYYHCPLSATFVVIFLCDTFRDGMEQWTNFELLVFFLSGAILIWCSKSCFS